jgi:antitoxin (DNA-binding transcriptional repressor) of toxin-antitoxin stability system
MKILTYEGTVLTLPFTMQDTPPGSFERIDGNGAVAKGVVSSMDDAVLARLILRAAGREDAFATQRDMTKDLRFIHRALIDIEEGAEVGIETRGSKIALLIPQDARPKPETLAVGDRFAINATVRPKVLLNAHGTVEGIKGDKATIALDEGDRQRLIRATGKDYPATMAAPMSILDKLPADK